jgi:histidinol dehydrogenase
VRIGRADAAAAAARVRASVPAGESVAEAVAEIVAAVRARGDAAVLELEARFGGGGPLRVEPADTLDPVVREAILLAAERVEAVARAGLSGDRTTEHGVTLREVPVARAGVYAPGGQAPYPSSIVMGVATARAAGVEEIAVCATHPVMVGAAAALGVTEVYAMGGAQAIAALAYGTETVRPVDVIVGPGALYAQEAKRQVASVVGIDGFAGPSDLVIVAWDGADHDLVRADAAAQAEHGAGTVVVVLAPAPIEGVETIVCEDVEAALAFSEAFAPEHLQLMGREAEALAPRVRRAGCVFVGNASGTAFGDYVAGSNHVLPTEGAARFASGLNVRHFTRVMAEVRLGGEDAAALAPRGAAIARAEGFEAHARSMEARIGLNGAP